MKAKKSFGQHFLINKPLAKDIVNFAVDRAGNLPILEVGPGRAALTKHLIKDSINFHAVDADQEMIEYLMKMYPADSDRFSQLDFLKAEFSSFFEDNEFLILGNFPYNISSQILVKIIDHRALVPKAVGMFQRELANRLVSPPGKKTYSRISVLVQAFYNVKLIFKVSRGSFSPPPKVDSSVLYFERKTISLGCDESFFRLILRLGFGQRRKMLKNTIGHLLKDDTAIKNPIFKNRPEQLSVQDFIDLTNLIAKTDKYEID